MKHDYSSLVTTTKQLETQKKSLSKIHEEISMRERLLGEKKKQQIHYVQNLKSEISEMERMTRELEASSQEITSQIMRMGKGVSYLGTGRFVKPTTGWVSSLF